MKQKRPSAFWHLENATHQDSTFFAHKDVSLPWEKPQSLWAQLQITQTSCKLLTQTCKIIERDHLSTQHPELEESFKKEPGTWYPDHPAFLHPAVVYKPWGFEFWWSGIEPRGISGISSKPQHPPIRLSTYLSVFADTVIEKPSQAPILLKTLSPFPHPLRGNLYYELHEHKSEVYIISHLDDLWYDPVKKRKIAHLYVGVSAQKRASFNSDAHFLQALSQVLKSYHKLQIKIEHLLTPFLKRAKTSYSCADFSTSHQRQLWWQEVKESEDSLPSSLKQQRDELKQELVTFFQKVEVEVGDVVSIPPRIPHSLQHGIEVIEFQTPHYERTIIGFDQPVWTQKHWDSEKALRIMSLKPYEGLPKPTPTPSSPSHVMVAEFTDFKVFLTTLPAQTSLSFTQSPHHGLLKILSGKASVTTDAQSQQQTQAPTPFKTLLTPPNTLYLPCSLPGYSLTSTDPSTPTRILQALAQ